ENSGALTTQPTCVAASPHTNAGAYAITCSGGAAANYSFSYVAGTQTVNKVALSVTVDSDANTAAIDHFSKPYGTANPTFGVRYSGFVNGDTAASLGGTLTFTTAATASSPVGSYGVTPTGLTSSNYTITFVGGTLDVTKAVLSVNAVANTKI